MHRIGIDERRARLGVRHRLATPAANPTEAARAVLALHATDPATVYLSVRCRVPTVQVTDIERALYEERSLLRMLGMRRTMFVLPTEDAPVIQSSCTDAVAATQRRRYAQLLMQAGAGDAAFLDDVAAATAIALDKRGEATGAQLSVDEPRLRTQVVLNQEKAYGGPQNITSWVLLLLAAEGKAVRGRPRGSWTSTQWVWSTVHRWLPAGMVELPAAEARVELVRRWLATFGPGTAAEIKWWTGWTGAQVKQALAKLGPVEVELDGGTGFVLPDDLGSTPRPDPWVALLPALDPTPMGWADRSWYLGPHSAALFDRNGNIGPTVWSDGRIIGGWAQRQDGEVVFRILEKVSPAVTKSVTAAAGRLTEWIGPTRITPRFRTPLERELSA